MFINQARGSTVIRPCSYKHDFQDATYGKQQRVHNVGGSKDSSERKIRCTVCATRKE